MLDANISPVINFPTCYVLLYMYSKTCLKRPLKKKAEIGVQDHLSLNAGQKYCRMLQDLHHKLPFVFKTFVLSIFEWPLKTGFTKVVFRINTIF